MASNPSFSIGRVPYSVGGPRLRSRVLCADLAGAGDTGTFSNEDWHTFEVELDAAGYTASFYIDGVRRGTASESPTEAGPTGLMPLQLVRLDGTGTKAAEIDYYKYEIRPSGPSPMYPE